MSVDPIADFEPEEAFDAPESADLEPLYESVADPDVVPQDLEILLEEDGTEGAGQVPPPETEEGE